MLYQDRVGYNRNLLPMQRMNEEVAAEEEESGGGTHLLLLWRKGSLLLLSAKSALGLSEKGRHSADLEEEKFTAANSRVSLLTMFVRPSSRGGELSLIVYPLLPSTSSFSSLPPSISAGLISKFSLRPSSVEMPPPPYRHRRGKKVEEE